MRKGGGEGEGGGKEEGRNHKNIVEASEKSSKSNSDTEKPTSYAPCKGCRLENFLLYSSLLYPTKKNKKTKKQKNCTKADIYGSGLIAG